MSQEHIGTTSKFGAADTVAWHRWLQPLQGVMAGHREPLDRKAIGKELAACAKGGALLDRNRLLTCLKGHLDSGKARLRHSFYESNDGAVYVGM